MTELNQEQETYCGFIAIVGRPNVGKSTLLNKILGQKISITSRKAQTTRHRIVGIKTEGIYQEIYVDTPGLHIEEKRAINRLMNRAASSAIGDVDLIIFVVDGTHWNADDEMVLNKLRNAKAPVVLAINKVDNIKNKDDLLPFITDLGSKFNFAHIVPISAQRGNNVHQLEKIVRQSLRKGVHHFPEDYVTDRSQRFMASEIIREKLMRFTGEELPYSVTVEIEQFKVNERGTYEINGLILVEREGQKKMVIGAQGQKISITSRKAQTTRHRIVGIKTEGIYQEIYVDTPGLHIEEKRAINRLMNRAASSAIGDVDLIIFVVDGTHWNADDEMVLNKLRNAKAPVVLAINKVDNVKNKDDLLPFITDLGSKFDFAHIVPISAQRGNNVHQLEKIVRQSLRKGVHHFPEDYVTDRSQRFMASEIIREKLMRFTGEELPYSVTVEIEQFKVNERGTYEINGLILVEREGQKKMVIGAQGQKIKTIGMEARADMERLFDNKVHLELWVKVKSGWADDERALRSLGYMDE